MKITCNYIDVQIRQIRRVGRTVHTTNMTVYLVISLPKLPKKRAPGLRMVVSISRVAGSQDCLPNCTPTHHRAVQFCVCEKSDGACWVYGNKGAAKWLGWPKPYIYTVYDRILGDFPAKNTVYTPYKCRVGQNPVYMHHIWPYIWWFPCQKYRIYTVYIWFWPTLHCIISYFHVSRSVQAVSLQARLLEGTA